MENEVIAEEPIETQQILTEEETRQQQVPKIDYEYCQVNNITDYDISRFWEKIKFPENLVDDCWIWTAFKDKYNYGQFWTGKSRDSAHRFSYNLFNGKIAKDLLVRHTCDNPSCVNPYHLLLGSCQDNSDDMVSRNRQPQFKGEDNGNSKLTENEVDEILYQLLQKVSVKYLAIQYVISICTIYDICKGKRWKQCYKKLSVSQKFQLKNINRLSLKETEEIRELNNTGVSQDKLAIKFKVCRPTINKIIKKIYPYDY